VAVGDALINFRFHLVSLTAVFLALAIGIAMGATVVQKKTVDALDARIKAVEQKVTPLEHQVDALNAQHGQDLDHAGAAADLAVAGRLPQVNVLLVATDGADRGAVEGLRDSLLHTGANVEGTLWLSAKLRLDKPADVQALAESFNVGTPTADALRNLLVTRLVASWAAEAGPSGSGSQPASSSGTPAASGTRGASSRLSASAPAASTSGGVANAGQAAVPSLTASLTAKSWLSWEPAPKTALTLGDLPLRNTYFVVVSDATAAVPNDQLALPLVTALATSLNDRVVAAEDGRAATDRAPAQRAIFLGPLRSNPELAGKLSTVDNLENPYGRVATVMALADEAQSIPKVGDFGEGPGVDRFLPEPSQ
jgi:Copper transport outer membrane protein, MctB